MAVNPLEQYQQVLSMALEERSKGYQDLVSNSNPVLAKLKAGSGWKTYSGPRIRETIQISKPDAQWYSGYDFLDNTPGERLNDAFFTPKNVAVPVSLPMDEILNNEGDNQIFDVMETVIDIAENSLADAMEVAIHGDGTANGGKQLTGLAATVPVVATTGTYGGIDRATNAIWRTTTYDANSFDTTIGTQVTSTTIRPFLNRIMSQRSRGTRYADVLLMSAEHYAAYDAATTAIQRIQREGPLAKLGFPSLAYVGAGRNAEIVEVSGIGTSMPADTTIGIDTKAVAMRYNPNRNFSKLFEGAGQKPINQDAIVQFIGWMGELTLNNPLFTWRFYDSNPAA